MLNKNKTAATPETAKDNAEKAKAASAATAEKVDEAVLGSKSDKIAFVAPLGDPSRDDVAYDANKERDVKPVTVGYAFKALEDMTIPDCGTEDDFKKNPMSYANPDGKKQVKAGEIFYLTRFETGMLLSAPEYNARATGGDMKVVVAYQRAGTKSSDGAVAKVSETTAIPNVSLRAMNGSIRDVKAINVLESKNVPIEGGNGTRKTRTLNPGFEKWAPLCATNVRKPSAQPSAPKNQRNANAAAFLSIVASKAKNRA